MGGLHLLHTVPSAEPKHIESPGRPVQVPWSLDDIDLPQPTFNM